MIYLAKCLEKKVYTKETINATILSVLKSSLSKTFNKKQIYLRLKAHTQKNSFIIEKSLLFLCNNKTLIKILLK